jgi:hypothetical protein
LFESRVFVTVSPRLKLGGQLTLEISCPREPILVESVLLYITVRVEKEDAAEECQEFRVDKKTGRYFRSFAAKSSIPFS